MIRTHRFKYIFNHGSTHEMYDSETDPGENTHRIHDPELKGKKNELHERLIAWYDPKKNPYRRTPQIK